MAESAFKNVLPADLVLCDDQVMEAGFFVGDGHLEVWGSEGSSYALY
jgi:hypothetical protein